VNKLIINETQIQNRIYETRNIQFILDSDLAELYGVETKRINEAVKNNVDKFPDDFYFELTKNEYENLRSKFSTFNDSVKNRKYASKVFTEQGIYMLATILKSKTATEVTISIIRAFAKMRKIIKV
jgi:phage regulator Rha-like protein